jgi:hypothetical protein
MAAIYSNAVMQAVLDAVETTVGTAPTIEIRTGSPPANCAAASTGTLLASLVLPSNWMNDASINQKQQAGSWIIPVTVAGTAGYFRIIKTGTCHIQGTIGDLVISGDIRLSTRDLVVGARVVIDALFLIGGVSGVANEDNTPDQFSFTSQTNVAEATAIDSNTVVPTGFNTTTTITVAGGQYSKNGGAFTSATGTFSPGDSVRARVTSSSSPGTATTVTVSIGGTSSTFSVTTAAAASGVARYIRTAAAGLANGTSWANAVAISSLNTMISQAGPGGIVYIRADEGDYTIGSVLTLSSGGSPGNPVTIRGVNVSLNPMKAVLKTSRTSPWPTGSVGANQGSDLFRLNAGANHITFQSMHWRDCKFAMRAADQHYGITFGSATYRDTAVAALIPADVFFNRDDPNYQTTVANIYSASAAGVSSAIQDFAIDMTNCYRGVDCGDPSASTTSDTFHDFAVYGGVHRGSARGWYRMRGAGRNHWYQDMDMDGGGKAYVSDDGSFCVGIELNGPDTAVPGSGISSVVTLRCIANNHRATTTAGSYSNGDGFSGERENQNTCYIRCIANGNEDGGIETKASGVTIIGFTTSGNRRNLRLWGRGADCFHITSTDPDATDRINTDRRHIFTESSTGWQRVFSGTFTSTTGSPLMGSSGVRGFIAIHTGVTLDLNGASTGAVTDSNTVRRIITDLFSTTALSITSSGAISQASGASVPYTPTSNVPAFFDNIGGPDSAQIAGPHTFSLPARQASSPQDADGNNTYLYTIEGVSASRMKATQNVVVTVT